MIFKARHELALQQGPGNFGLDVCFSMHQQCCNVPTKEGSNQWHMTVWQFATPLFSVPWSLCMTRGIPGYKGMSVENIEQTLWPPTYLQLCAQLQDNNLQSVGDCNCTTRPSTMQYSQDMDQGQCAPISQTFSTYHVDQLSVYPWHQLTKTTFFKTFMLSNIQWPLVLSVLETWQQLLCSSCQKYRLPGGQWMSHTWAPSDYSPDVMQ